MSKLNYIGRPWVIFDAGNKNHRRWFAEFQKYASWGHCPVRFIVDDEGLDLVTMIQRKLIEYYTEKEFRGQWSKETVRKGKTKYSASSRLDKLKLADNIK